MEKCATQRDLFTVSSNTILLNLYSVIDRVKHESQSGTVLGGISGCKEFKTIKTVSRPSVYRE